MTDGTPHATEKAQVWRSCYTCRDYVQHRSLVLAPALADKARREGRADVTAVVDEFMLAAHMRHVGGDPLRLGGPTRVTDPFIGRLAAVLSPGPFDVSFSPGQADG